jgi:hypothetical protein
VTCTTLSNFLSARNFDEAAAKYKMCERHCLWTKEHVTIDEVHEVEVWQQLKIVNRVRCAARCLLPRLHARSSCGV